MIRLLLAVFAAIAVAAPAVAYNPPENGGPGASVGTGTRNVLEDERGSGR